MTPASGQWSDEQMMNALNAGVQADAVADSEPQFEQANTPAQGSPAGESASHAQDVQPATPVAPEQQNTGLFDGTPINPDQLIQEHPELAPLVKQLEGAFTQKTQDLSEQRKQFEALGEIESVQQAVDLYSRITDPANWAQLHSELSDAMQQYGMTPQQASAAASEQMANAAVAPAEQAGGLDLSELEEDPQLAPLAAMLKQQQAEIDRLKSVATDVDNLRSERQQEVENQRAEYERQAFLGELQRQENAIRAAHPEWDDEKILAVYEMSSFYNGNLSQAAERLNTLLGKERELYLSNKASAMEHSGVHPAPRGAGLTSQKVDAPQTIREAEAGAEEFFRNRVAQLDG